jgi:hypothetical protein
MTAIARAPRRAPAGRARPHRHHQRLASGPLAPGTRRRLAAALGLLPLVSGLVLGSAVAERAPAVSGISSSEAARAGRAIVITRREDLAHGLAEVRVPSAIAATRATGADQLLAVAPDAGTAAVAGRIGPDSTPLVLARSDGSQIQVELPGLIAAAFAPDESWLAAIDGSGALWRIVAADGTARLLAAGPFIGQPAVEADGSVVALRVPSVEAPFRSTAVRVAASGAVGVLSDEPLVYDAQPLSDGSLAVTAHRPSGTVVLRLAGNGATTLADLGPDAVNVAVSQGADAVAWERDGEVFLRRLPGGGGGRIAAGTHPRFSPDGSALLVDVPSGTQLVDRDGSLIATFTSQLGFGACPAGCAP